uniref:Uncharacterized protein n=1 Tax=Cyprinus carpio TaxID=7962 RepID=A0A8C1J6Z7_CYPCA
MKHVPHLPQSLWEEHLAEVEKMLPYLVAAGHYKYVSCLPHYLEAMRSLPTLAPNIYREFKDGNSEQVTSCRMHTYSWRNLL